MGWEDEFTYLQVGCSLPGLYMSLYHVVYLVGTWQSVTGAGKKMQVFVGTIGATMLYVKGRARIRWIRWSGFHDLKTRWLTLCFSKRTCFAWMNDSLVYPKITYTFLENQSVFLILLKKVSLICMYIYIQTWFDKTIQQMSTARTGSASGLGFGSHETLAGSSTWASKLTQFVGVKQPQVTDL